MSRTTYYDMNEDDIHNSTYSDVNEIKEDNNWHHNNVIEPEHYKQGDFETIDEMIIMFGVEAVVQFCKINARKYRARAPYKNNFEQDMEKANTYLKFALQLEESLDDVPLLKYK